MKIALVNIGYPPFLGGSQRYVQEVAQRLAAEGHQVTAHVTDAGEVEAIWHAGKRRLRPGVERDGAVTVIRHPIEHLRPSPWAYYALRRVMPLLDERPAFPDALMARLGRLAPRAPGLRQGLHTGDVDLIHAFTIPFESLVLDAVEAAQQRGVPLVLTPFFHTGEQNDPAVSRSYGMRHQLAALRHADAVMAMTEIERDYLASQGVPAERISVVGGGINPAEVTGGDGRGVLLRRKIRRPMALFLGAVTYDKGAVHVLEAMQLLWQRKVPAHLVIAGTVVTQFSNFFRTLQPKDLERCHLLGPVSDAEKRDLLAACDVLAMPSRVDSFGLAYLEAWANGKPVIGARAGGVPSLISHEEDGYLVNFGDTGELAQRLRYLLTYTGEAQEMGERGRAKLQAQYTWDHVYERIREVYRETLDAARAGRREMV